MRAQRRKRTHFPFAVFIHGYRFTRPAIQHAPGAPCQIFNVGDVALQETLVLAVDLDGVAEHARQAGRHAEDAFGRVDGAPGGGGLGNEVGDEFGSEGVVHEAVAYVAGLDVDV